MSKNYFNKFRDAFRTFSKENRRKIKGLEQKNKPTNNIIFAKTSPNCFSQIKNTNMTTYGSGGGSEDNGNDGRGPNPIIPIMLTIFANIVIIFVTTRK
jgi:hypothetical protein